MWSARRSDLVLLSPMFLAAALAIKLDSKGGVFFRQERIGRGQKPFTIVKFRTMDADADSRKAEVEHLNKHRGLGDDRMFKIPDDPRVTRVGRFLRRTSIDEFPQLWNVLRGEMSLVGPRPLIPHEHKFVNDWGLRRLDLTPGLTGLWQVCGRSEVTFSPDAGAGLPVRHQLEPLGRHHADPAHRARAARQDPRGISLVT